MALAVERNYPGEVQGVAITRYSHALPTMKIRVVEAGHPVPDERGLAAAVEVEAMAPRARPRTTAQELLK